MLSQAAKNLADATIAIIANDEDSPTATRVDSVLHAMRAAIPMSDADFESARRHVQARLILVMDKGIVVATKFEHWLRHKKADMPTYYWQRFRSHLVHDLGWGFKVVRALDDTTDDLLDYAGDPAASGAWKRRGLVVGNVQSGKTATYTALCNKAADAGYKLIILLAGTLNSLRYQTQQRLDEGFVGFDRAQANLPGGGAVIGVGRFDNSHAPNAFTTKLSDFDAGTLNIRTRLDGLSQPALMVVKKNKTILRNLHKWLKDQNPSSSGKIDVPLLLIDDEADAASVNTGDETNPRAINAGIRELLKLFSKSSYVGFTATPFANVFISPDSATEALEDDLFPRDYIYSLEPPSNYIGPVRIFLQQPEQFLRPIEDAAPFFPPKHKKDLIVDELPESLYDATYCFLLVNAIRDLRGQINSHRSMLVNVSWANNVQMQVADLLKREVDAVILDAKSYGRLTLAQALRESSRLQRLHAVWTAQFSSLPHSFEDILAVLYDGIKAIDVRAVNMTSKTSRLDYDANMSLGLRVIAVGGNALSRGLTLEGLSTSYLFRNSQAYDTLLQMGRWFGYRPGYDDLCRIWLTDEAAGWYTHITEATEELRSELRRMHRLNSTPEEFGLRVRAHPDALIVTARNKMRSATEVVEAEVNLSARRIDGVRLPSRVQALENNTQAVGRLLSALASPCLMPDAGKRAGSTLWRNVPKRHIVDLLSDFQLHPSDLSFQAQQIAAFLQDADISELSEWDVTIAAGKENNTAGMIGGVPYRTVLRGLIPNAQERSIEIYKIRLGTSGDEAVGLSVDDLERSAKAWELDKAEHAKNYYYRIARGRPLLILYFIEASQSENIQNSNALKEPPYKPFISLSLSFPRYAGGESRPVIYNANKVWQQMRLSLASEIDEDLENEDAALVG